MIHEEFNEDGIVIESVDGKADVALLRTDNCEECSAKIFCKPKADNTKILRVSDPIGVQPGDQVRISVGGGSILKYSLIVYGIPLFLLVGGILFGYYLFANSASPELFSFIFGLILTAIYFFVAYITLRNNINDNIIPRITFVSKK
ncbi:MAG: hypothetical protein SCALA702_16110 [Melioribacteraceae bacterium]|nr:MAG: hypothetical protein SCALA702_16110 [Melioribacteraceae bacterium]